MMQSVSKSPREATSIILSQDDRRTLDERVAALRELGLTTATRSTLIRVALEQLDFPRLVAAVQRKYPPDASPKAQPEAVVIGPSSGTEDTNHARPEATSGAGAPETAAVAGERTTQPLHIDDTEDEASSAPGPAADNQAGEILSRDVLRSRRKHPVRAKTLSTKRMSKRDLYLGRLLYPAAEDGGLPKQRGDCEGGARPCPLVSCKYNLYLDVHPQTGSIKLNFPDREPEDMPADKSCTLDKADDGGHTLESVAELLNITRERVRQVEVKALVKAEVAVSEELKLMSLGERAR